MDGVHRLDRRHIADILTEDAHAVHGGVILQQVVAARAGGHEVDGREHALVAQRAVELQLHVARSLELLEDHLVHLGTRINQGRGDDSQRTATLDVARSTEEALRLLKGIGIDTTREHLAAGGSHGIVGARQTS